MNPPPSIFVAHVDTHWLAAANRCLSPDEESRAARFRAPTHRNTWRAGRAWLRHELAAALGTLPAALAFATDSLGRPHVTDAPPGFDCNWSHSGPWIALAITTQGAVGIDVEALRSDFPIGEVEATVCTPAERAALAAATDDTARTRLFFRLWTAKEALMKATGLGAALDPSTIDVRLPNCRPTGYASHPAWLLATREGDDWVAAWAWNPEVAPRPYGLQCRRSEKETA